MLPRRIKSYAILKSKHFFSTFCLLFLLGRTTSSKHDILPLSWIDIPKRCKIFFKVYIYVSIQHKPIIKQKKLSSEKKSEKNALFCFPPCFDMHWTETGVVIQDWYLYNQGNFSDKNVGSKFLLKGQSKYFDKILWN